MQSRCAAALGQLTAHLWFPDLLALQKPCCRPVILLQDRQQQVAGIGFFAAKVPGCENLTWNDVQIASTIFAVKPGDGSAREQAASCQRVLGAGANIVTEYATKRYRSNLINWGMLPLQLVGATPFGLGDYVFIPNVREALKGDLQNIKAYVLGDTAKEFSLYMAPLTADERKILADGCLINFYKH